jgi:hypothetical protein
MRSLAEPDLGQDLLCQGEDLSLIHTTELCVNVKVLLVQTLHDGVLSQKLVLEYLGMISINGLHTINALRGALSVQSSVS